MTPFLLADLKVCEGFRARAYPDPESPLAKTGQGSGAPWTIGYGHAGLDVHPGMEWTLEQAETVLQADLNVATGLLDHFAPWWRRLNDPRQDVMAQLAFNMGWGNGEHGLSSFKHTLGFIQAGDFEEAAAGLLASHWADEVKTRAIRLAEQMRTGVRAA